MISTYRVKYSSIVRLNDIIISHLATCEQRLMGVTFSWQAKVKLRPHDGTGCNPDCHRWLQSILRRFINVETKCTLRTAHRAVQWEWPVLLEPSHLHQGLYQLWTVNIFSPTVCKTGHGETEPKYSPSYKVGTTSLRLKELKAYHDWFWM